MAKYLPYPCERCGECCRHIDLLDEMKTFDRGDGVCKHLTAENLCEIYSERPPLCNGEFVYQKFFSDLSVAQFHALTRELCDAVRRRELDKLHQEVSHA